MSMMKMRQQKVEEARDKEDKCQASQAEKNALSYNK